MERADWIACDWGTSNLRVWALDAGGAVRDARVSDQGMGRLAASEFEAAFLDLAGDLIGAGPRDVVICGMAGARQGWCEAPYLPVPARPAADGAVTVPTADPRIRVRILPGLSQTQPEDVMRGEETQIAGVLAARPDFDGVMCLPGTHTKWVRVQGGEVVRFRTFMTGELFALLSTQSVLKHSFDDGWSAQAFLAAGGEALAAPERMTAALFSLRAASLLGDVAAGSARARLSGLLTGIELAGARPFWEKHRVLIVGGTDEGDRGALLTRAGARVEHTNARDATLSGLVAAHALNGETP
ncbi:2-dehydro-3-deoxygalactonokinase [Maritimibacter sp. UBA3975]|uniref:2-dehydro-3-deoxygalactonokinase n=1 Tax=Maritimibacter sp. UBA3975 TaxID=1946833 RepID=UPI000C0B20F8|nr:2-dehydro-3-deoxygalactonokinase [Maritimibacter sp. UBA3975]MAM62954.1 2-keto-3-deoxy-galactonokinase [Maritimibacter sp.]|tara:strand:+ start:26430 stop:27326 length:897 start_codon:yes stop_codon:yes gene_type:complete